MRPSLSADDRAVGVIGTLSTIPNGAREVKPAGRGTAPSHGKRPGSRFLVLVVVLVVVVDSWASARWGFDDEDDDDNDDERQLHKSPRRGAMLPGFPPMLSVLCALY